MGDMVFLQTSHGYKVWDIVSFFITNPIPWCCIGTKIISIYEYKWELWFSLSVPKELEWTCREKRLRDADLTEITK